MKRLLYRSAHTALRLPFAMAWDLISLGNMGDGSSTVRVLREHEARKTLDDTLEIVEQLKQAMREAD